MRAVPKEIPAVRSLKVLAPRFAAAVSLVLIEVPHAVVAESIRSPERQSFLYGFGREYDDGRGIVTQAPTNLTSWHGFGLAVDIIHAARGWDAPDGWWRMMGECAERHGLTWGGRWRHRDLPHLQFGACKVSPSDHARALYASGGVEAVWKAVGAMD